MEFSNIRYSAGWLAQKFPGFYSEDCYRILADYYKESSEKYLEKFQSDNNERHAK
jgi:hypothetical protein